MNQTTKETRRNSYDAVLPKRAARCRLILETLGNRELTASEITEELVAAGRIPYFNRNYVAPRLTELKEIGILTTVGRRKATRSDATEAVWARNVTAPDLQKIDLVIGGSPCQGFSRAGAGLNFDDPRSRLFFDYVRVLNEVREKNPDVKFLLENVIMKREWEADSIASAS